MPDRIDKVICAELPDSAWDYPRPVWPGLPELALYEPPDPWRPAHVSEGVHEAVYRGYSR